MPCKLSSHCSTFLLLLPAQQGFAGLFVRLQGLALGMCMCLSLLSSLPLPSCCAPAALRGGL